MITESTPPSHSSPGAGSESGEARRSHDVRDDQQVPTEQASQYRLLVDRNQLDDGSTCRTHESCVVLLWEWDHCDAESVRGNIIWCRYSPEEHSDWMVSALPDTCTLDPSLRSHRHQIPGSIMTREMKMRTSASTVFLTRSRFGIR